MIDAIAGTNYAIAVSSVGGEGGTLSLSIVPSAPPTVSITDPAPDATFYVGIPVTFSAAATDPDGTITNVAFYVDNALVGSVTSSPFHTTVTFTNGPALRRVSAWATDNSGLTTVSRQVNFTVTYPPPPNDNFANRSSLSGADFVGAGSNLYATREDNEPSDGLQTVWWSWTATNSGTYTITAVGVGLFYPVLSAYSGTELSSLVLVTNAAFGGIDSTYAARIVLEAISGQTYAIALGAAGGAGDFNLSISSPAAAGTLTRFNSITRLADGSCRLVFRTDSSSHWKLQSSTDLVNWQGSGFSFMPDGLYDVRDLSGQGSPCLFYRLRADP